MEHESHATTILPCDCPVGTRLRILGDVGQVLRSTSEWHDGPSATHSTIHAISLPLDQCLYGLGAGGFGATTEEAVDGIGECALFGGLPAWTPARPDAIGRIEAHSARLLTPFLFAWDTLATCVAYRTSSQPISLVAWYEYLLGELSRSDLGSTGALAVQITAIIPASQLVDKRLCVSPLAAHRPMDGRLITDVEHLDEYFTRNVMRAQVTAAGLPPESLCTVVMVGVAVDAARVRHTWGNARDVLRRGFYVTPGISQSSSTLQHTHALATVGVPEDNDVQYLIHGSQHLQAAVEDTIERMTGWVTHRAAPQLIHIENDTQVQALVARIGSVQTMEFGGN